MPAVPPRSSPFWAPHVHADRRPILLARGRIVAALRAWFAGQDFVEVDTSALQVSPGNEIHLHAFATALAAPGEVLVSQTVRDLVAGLGLTFAERGVHTLKGAPSEWRLFQAIVD